MYDEKQVMLTTCEHLITTQGWSGGAVVLGKLPAPGRPTICMIVGQGPVAFAVGVGGGRLNIFKLLYLSSPLSPSLWPLLYCRIRCY